RAQGMDGQVVIKQTNFIAGLADKGGAVDIKGHVVGKVHVARVIDEAPAGTIDHGTAVHNCRRSGCANEIEVHRVAAARLGAGAGNQLAVRVELRIVDRYPFVGAVKAEKFRVVNVREAVHEHRVTAIADDGRILRLHHNVPIDIGEVNRHAAGSGVIVRE